jgi:hypothetical protein
MAIIKTKKVLKKSGEMIKKKMTMKGGVMKLGVMKSSKKRTKVMRGGTYGPGKNLKRNGSKGSRKSISETVKTEPVKVKNPGWLKKKVTAVAAKVKRVFSPSPTKTTYNIPMEEIVLERGKSFRLPLNNTRVIVSEPTQKYPWQSGKFTGERAFTLSNLPGVKPASTVVLENTASGVSYEVPLKQETLSKSQKDNALVEQLMEVKKSRAGLSNKVEAGEILEKILRDREAKLREVEAKKAKAEEVEQKKAEEKAEKIKAAEEKKAAKIKAAEEKKAAKIKATEVTRGQGVITSPFEEGGKTNPLYLEEGPYSRLGSFGSMPTLGTELPPGMRPHRLPTLWNKPGVEEGQYSRLQGYRSGSVSREPGDLNISRERRPSASSLVSESSIDLDPFEKRLLSERRNSGSSISSRGSSDSGAYATLSHDMGSNPSLSSLAESGYASGPSTPKFVRPSRPSSKEALKKLETSSLSLGANIRPYKPGYNPPPGPPPKIPPPYQQKKPEIVYMSDSELGRSTTEPSPSAQVQREMPVYAFSTKLRSRKGNSREENEDMYATLPHGPPPPPPPISLKPTRI